MTKLHRNFKYIRRATAADKQDFEKVMQEERNFSIADGRPEEYWRVIKSDHYMLQVHFQDFYAQDDLSDPEQWVTTGDLVRCPVCGEMMVYEIPEDDEAKEWLNRCWACSQQGIETVLVEEYV